MTLEATSHASLEPQLAHQLGVQTQQINRVMEQYDAEAEVVGGQIHQSSITYEIKSRLTIGWERLRVLKQDLLTALRSGDIGVSRGDDGWQLRLARPAEPPVPLMRLLASIGPLSPATAAVGLSIEGNPVLLRFGPDEVTHALISGDTNSGKTTLLRTIAVGLALNNRQSDLQLLLVEGQESQQTHGLLDDSSALYPLSYLPHLLTDPVAGPDAAGEVLHFLAAEMDHRRTHKVRRPVIIVLIDHLVVLLEASEASLTDDLIRLLQYGPAAGIHVVAATSRPASEAIDVMLRSNMPVRLVGQMADPEAARRAGGIRNTGAENLVGEGDFLALSDGECAHFQAAAISDYELHYQLTQLYQAGRPRLLAQSWSTRPTMKREQPPPKPEPVPFTARNGTVEVKPPPQPQPKSRPAPAEDGVEDSPEPAPFTARSGVVKPPPRPQPRSRPTPVDDEFEDSSEPLPF